MRYIAKVYVSDVMDQVVVSGYVVDADPLSDPDHQAVDFTYQGRGAGISEPLLWLQRALQEAAPLMSSAPQRES